MMFAKLLAHPEVQEVVELRGKFGFMAYHGGGLEHLTDVIAQQAAEQSDSSYYGVHQPQGLKWHEPRQAARMLLRPFPERLIR